ncbi:clarin-3-like [Chrysoperla carnea]|uniref:clarin-3-like n=1 Tax=Chrysoperla carnea TaxID=189513 RepID=UPI001D079882|nr:clarin-3-like [Chrysoperla carnea]
MNLFKRGMIFVTFFGSCFAIALLLASLGTRQWLVARAKSSKNPDSDGRVQLGLFDGKKELNVAYGWRTDNFTVITILREDPDYMVFSLWLATVGTVCGGLLFAGLSAIFAVINTASNPICTMASVPGLYLWNTLAMLSDLSAVGCWIAQYYLKLQYNVMTKEDKNLMWTSDGMAEFGYSFWFVVGASIVSFVNLLIIYIGTSDTREIEPVIPVIEEKTNGAIMLY